MGATGSCEVFGDGELEAELTKRGGRGDLSVTQAVQSGYNQMISWLLQPPRKTYTLGQLGPTTWTLGDGCCVTRADFNAVCNSVSDNEPYSVRGYLWRAATESRPLVVYMHSNMASSIDAIPVRDACLGAGFDFATFDFGGCGLSTGPFVTGGYEERLQLQAVLSTLVVLEPSYKTVFLWGHSLGAATALEFAATTREETLVAGLVLDSPYTSLADMIQSCFENAKNQGLYLPGVVLWMTMALARKSIQSRAGFSLDAVHPEHASRKCTMPALFFNGSHDLYVPPLMASRLHTAYAGHATHLSFDGDHYGQRPIGVQKSAIAFLKSLITRA